MKKIIILIISGLLIGCSKPKNDLTDKDMIELFLKYVEEIQEEGWIRAGIKATPKTRPLYHVLSSDLIGRIERRNQLWKKIEKIEELKEEAIEQKKREARVREGEDYREVFFKPIIFDVTKKENK